MDWHFSFGWMILGLLITVAGTLIVGNYQKISDNMLSGISSYERCKFWGLVTIGVGLAIMANLHTLILTALVKVVFHIN